MKVIKTLCVGLIVALLSLTNYSTAYAVFVTTVGANINVSQRAGNQTEATIAIDPTNPQRVFVASNNEPSLPNGLFAARSTDGGTTWTRAIIASGPGGDGLAPACCDPSASWDQFGNLFLTYLNSVGGRIELILSTDGGATFTSIGPLDTPATAPAGVDQPTVISGAGSVWVTWRRCPCGIVSPGSIVARGAQVTGLGVVGAFNVAQAAPGSAGGHFGDISIGPAGQMMVTYQIPSGGQGPATIFVNLDADGLGVGGFAAQVTATATNVGGFDFIPPQPDRSVDAEAGLAWDRSGSPRNGRVYLVYTEEMPNESNDTDIFVRFSDNNGATWSAPVQVNDDTTTNSQFFPRIALDQATGNIAVTWHDARSDGGTGPADADGPNNDAQFWGAFSTDGGATFQSNFQISAGTSDEDVAEPPLPCCADIDYGDYTGADFFSGILRPVWADNSNSTGDNPNGTLNRFDIYTARITLVDNLPPSVDTGMDVSGLEGDAIQLNGTVSDPNGDTLATAWTFTAGAGVDAGATCTFADATNPGTTITCTDDGTYTATLTASDGINPAVTDSAAVTVGNVAPTINITTPNDGARFRVNKPVNLTASFADAGTNDTHTCAIDWGDGTITMGGVTEAAGAGTCTDSHTFSVVGTYTIQVSLSDDDGATSVATVKVIVKRRAGEDNEEHDDDDGDDGDGDENLEGEEGEGDDEGGRGEG